VTPKKTGVVGGGGVETKKEGNSKMCRRIGVKDYPIRIETQQYPHLAFKKLYLASSTY